MKVRVIEKDGKYYSQYLPDNRKFGPQWCGTHYNNNLGGPPQNEFDSLPEAQQACIDYANEHSEGKVVWQDEI